MSAEDSGAFGFTPPPFKPDDALLQLKRSLRDLKFSERGSGFERHGKRVVEWAVDAVAIHVRIARKLSATPDWDKAVVRSDADQRKLLADIKARLARWDSDE